MSGQPDPTVMMVALIGAWLWACTVSALCAMVVVIAWRALGKARREDIPIVLAVLAGMLSPLSTWLPRRRLNAPGDRKGGAAP